MKQDYEREDEQFIKEANEYKKETRGSIYSNIFVKGEEMLFDKFIFEEDRIEVYLPVDFIDIPEPIKKYKYPSEGRPKYIKTHRLGGVDFGLNPLPLEGTDAMTKEVGEQMYQITKNYKPYDLFLDKESNINENTNKLVFWFDFITRGIDAMIYNFMGVTSVAGKQLNFVFNCNAEEKDIWKPIAKEVFMSIKTYE
ncbi:MAG: hypothetical protein IKK33_06360 [Lachnospiraceae bacterium]|nr:hypothetical protein [Lachnospiraceae bacterium]